MILPPLLMLTDRSQLPPGRRLVEHTAYAARAGVRAVVLRERDLPAAERHVLAYELSALLDPLGGALIVASPGIPGVDGIHLRSDDELPDTRSGVVGRSCHSAAELERARDERVDYVVLGPVAATRSKPGYGPALGPSGLRQMLATHTGPTVYALGGVTADNATEWLDAGADGVAVMGELMRPDDPGTVATRLLDRIEAA